jgi:hypothetical protein
MKTLFHIIDTSDIIDISCIVAVVLMDMAAISIWLMNHIQLEQLNKIIN